MGKIFRYNDEMAKCGEIYPYRLPNGLDGLVVVTYKVDKREFGGVVTLLDELPVPVSNREILDDLTVWMIVQAGSFNRSRILGESLVRLRMEELVKQVLKSPYNDSRIETWMRNAYDF